MSSERSLRVRAQLRTELAMPYLLKTFEDTLHSMARNFNADLKSISATANLRVEECLILESLTRV